MSEGQVDVYGGVDTHRDVHVAAVLDGTGRILGTASFPADKAGYEQLGDWMGSQGRVARVGVEGTGSYGAGLARHLTSIGFRVVEVKNHRWIQAKSKPSRYGGKPRTASCDLPAC